MSFRMDHTSYVMIKLCSQLADEWSYSDGARHLPDDGRSRPFQLRCLRPIGSSKRLWRPTNRNTYSGRGYVNVHRRTTLS